MNFFSGILFRIFTVIFICISILQCETAPVKKKELTPMEKLNELSKGAIILHVYSIIQGAATVTPDTSLSIINVKTKKIYDSNIMDRGMNVFLNIPPGDYRLHQVFYEDPLIYPVINVLIKTIDDKRIQLPVQKTENIEDDDLFLPVKARKLQYGGDFSIYIQSNSIKTAPPDFEKEITQMKQGSELILTKFPHSRWAVEAMKILELESSF